MDSPLIPRLRSGLVCPGERLPYARLATLADISKEAFPPKMPIGIFGSNDFSFGTALKENSKCKM